jgi:hypothetical protein
MEIFLLETSSKVFISDIIYVLDVEWGVEVLDIKKIKNQYIIKTLSNDCVHKLLSFSEIYGCRGIWKIKKLYIFH